MENLPQKLLENAVEELNRLPGIGRRTALRLALFLLSQEESMVEKFSETLIDFRKNIKYCKICHNISDTEICEICASPKREHRVICVVSDVRDVMAIENTGMYRGSYHVLGGLINPLAGISPSQLHIASLVERVQKEKPEEVIFALPATPEGDTTAFYISRQITPSGVKITTLSKGIAIGDDLEYTDELTLGRSLSNRVSFGLHLD
ncbi:MAG: recombination mediator RecR [Bacteroidales bacterium]|nr:recombination mediator RecR [Bacteroidales bacterium]MDE7102046.1 recombination mediator RecR [Bacteroidales bacterium]